MKSWEKEDRLFHVERFNFTPRNISSLLWFVGPTLQNSILTSAKALAQCTFINADLLDTLQARVWATQDTKAKVKHQVLG